MHITPISSPTTEPLQLVHLHICGLQETAIGEGQFMLLFVDSTIGHKDQYILNYMSEAQEMIRKFMAIKEK